MANLSTLSPTGVRASVSFHEVDPSWLIMTINLVVVILPLLGFVTAAVLLWNVGFNWLHLAVFVVMVLGTGLGITVGFHRLFTHRSFETPRWLNTTFAILGSMAVEGPLLDWVATHRMHHQHSDEHDDPHSPHLHGHGFRGIVRGLWHAHLGWLFEREPDGLARYAGDLEKDRRLKWISEAFPLWAVLSLALPMALGGLISMSWKGAFLGLAWGGFARIFVVHHVTWSINSVCHLWGSRDYETGDESRNNAVFGILAFGEGWHNNHHAFPNSARHGMKWWQFDGSYLLIQGLEVVGLATKVRRPTAAHLAAKVRTSVESSA